MPALRLDSYPALFLKSCKEYSGPEGLGDHLHLLAAGHQSARSSNGANKRLACSMHCAACMAGITPPDKRDPAQVAQIKLSQHTDSLFSPVHKGCLGLWPCPGVSPSCIKVYCGGNTCSLHRLEGPSQGLACFKGKSVVPF